ncbi:MAG: hypothetical protein WDO70_09120 [Alphaproteobacteria bacterium]
MTATATYFPRSVHDLTIRAAANTGRRITAGLTVVNRAGKGARSRVWLPGDVTRDPEKLAAHEFKAEWVAVREIDIARQYGNDMIYDMDVESQNHLKWALYDHSKMTDDGYRMVVVTMGLYESSAMLRGGGDELQIFDRALRDRVQQIVNILWDMDRGTKLSDALNRQLWFKGWDEKLMLPDIGINLAGLDLLYRQKSWHTPNPVKKMNYTLTRKFLDLVGQLRRDNFHSDQVMFGIHIPEFDKSHEWIYLADGDQKIWEFNSVISSIYSKFDMWSVGSGYGVQPTVMHLPSYRHRQSVQSMRAA